MKLTIDLTDKMDILEAITMLRNLAGLENGAAVPANSAPAPEPRSGTVQAPAPAPAPEPKAKKENVFKAPAKAKPEPVAPPPMENVTIPDIQAVIKEHLKLFAPGSKELMDERNNLIEILREAAGVGSSADIPDDRLSDTFIAITQYINNRGDE